MPDSLSSDVVIQSGVPLRIAAAVDDATGEVIDVDARISWLLDVVEQLSVALMQSCWRTATFTALHSGVDALGRKLPPVASTSAQPIPDTRDTPVSASVRDR